MITEATLRVLLVAASKWRRLHALHFSAATIEQRPVAEQHVPRSVYLAAEREVLDAIAACEAPT